MTCQSPSPLGLQVNDRLTSTAQHKAADLADSAALGCASAVHAEAALQASGPILCLASDLLSVDRQPDVCLPLLILPAEQKKDINGCGFRAES